MASIDDFWEKRFENDADGLKEYRETRKKWQEEFENKDHIERKKVAELFMESTREKIKTTIDALSENELLNIYAHLERVKKTVEKRYHEKLDEETFSVSNVTFKEVVKRNQWEDVKKTLLTLFPDQIKSINGYEHVFKELQRLEPTSNEENFVIVMRLVEDGEDSYYDIAGRKKGDMESYALDFTPWEEWLGFFCDEKSIQTQGDLAFIVHCLWEMTFDGFEQSQIQESLEELKKRAEEIQKDRP